MERTGTVSPVLYTILLPHNSGTCLPLKRVCSDDRSGRPYGGGGVPVSRQTGGTGENDKVHCGQRERKFGGSFKVYWVEFETKARFVQMDCPRQRKLDKALAPPDCGACHFILGRNMCYGVRSVVQCSSP